MKIVVLGYIVRGPLGGLAWHHFQYVLGLKSMGLEVLFLEDSDDYPSCYNPETFEVGTDPSYGLKFISDFFNKYDIKDNWSYFDAHANRWYGQDDKKVKQFCNNADVVLNISGVNPLRPWCNTIPVRVLIDTDPVFTQIKHLANKNAMRDAKAHTHFATFAENYGKKTCTIPDDGLPWKPTRQPVFLNAWKKREAESSAKWTTVMQWDSYKAQSYDGVTYKMKSASFETFISLPELTSETLELALGSPNAPKEELLKSGWHIDNPLKITKTPFTFQQYISQSKGEWSVAKHGYVVTRSGWFSERSLNYLASYKPVVVQDTGFSDYLLCGAGILPFSTAEQAAEQLDKASKDYNIHCKQARKIVEEHFASEKVLSRLIKSLY